MLRKTIDNLDPSVCEGLVVQIVTENLHHLFFTHFLYDFGPIIIDKNLEKFLFELLIIPGTLHGTQVVQVVFLNEGEVCFVVIHLLDFAFIHLKPRSNVSILHLNDVRNLESNVVNHREETRVLSIMYLLSRSFSAAIISS